MFGISQWRVLGILLFQLLYSYFYFRVTTVHELISSCFNEYPKAFVSLNFCSWANVQAVFRPSAHALGALNFLYTSILCGRPVSEADYVSWYTLYTHFMLSGRGKLCVYALLMREAVCYSRILVIVLKNIPITERTAEKILFSSVPIEFLFCC